MKQYTVYMANNDVMKVYKKWYDFWFIDNPFSSMFRFRLADGDVVKVSKHFTIKVVEHKNA